VIRRAARVILAAILGVWQPLEFALELGRTLPTLGIRGFVGIVELLAHGSVAALCTAAARALWASQPHARFLARLGLVGATAVTIQRLFWSVLPRDIVPGTRVPIATIAVIHCAAWLIFLRSGITSDS
jgi:hypothetical protein